MTNECHWWVVFPQLREEVENLGFGSTSWGALGKLEVEPKL
jgi:hypothetical protein